MLLVGMLGRLEMEEKRRAAAVNGRRVKIVIVGTVEREGGVKKTLESEDTSHILR
jgi:hypothetical protein